MAIEMISMIRLLLDQPAWVVLLCLLAGIGYATLLYTAKAPWSKNWNRSLFVLRAVVATALMLLVLGPMLKMIQQQTEPPAVVVITDNSTSVAEKSDTVAIRTTSNRLASVMRESNRAIQVVGLSAKNDTLRYNENQSDLTGALRSIAADWEGKNLSAVVLISDGIYNNGLSPAYLPFATPVYTIGVGDSTEHTDVAIRTLNYNRIVYQGNRFALHADVQVTGLPDKEITVEIRRNGKTEAKARQQSGKKSILAFEFQLDAAEKGFHRYEVIATPEPGETNVRNNRTSAYIEVVEGRKRILILASSPHPDIHAIRTVLDQSANYEVKLHIPGVMEADPAWMESKKADLLIAHQSPDVEGRTQSILAGWMDSETPVLFINGVKTALRQLPALGTGVSFDAGAQRDEVMPVLNAAYQDLNFTEHVSTAVSRFPPVSVPFGKVAIPTSAHIILHQRIGNVLTERPLLFVNDQDQRKTGMMIGEGLWKWRLAEYQETGKTVAFDELISKVIQYLSTRDERKRFRCFPIQQEFSLDETVVLEAQSYNELFEPVYGQSIQLEIRNEAGAVTRHEFTTSNGNNRYRLGGLEEGVYRFTATTTLGGQKQESRGVFLVTEQNRELQNLTADFGVLRTLSANTGGKFYPIQQADSLVNFLQQASLKGVIRTDETFQPLINLKWVFALLLFLLTVEWLLRKYLGSY